MSRTIDERVVEMKFDNKQFETNVRTSMSTLEKLKDSLNMRGAAKSFEELDKASKKVDMSGLGSAVESVRLKFSALQVVAITALQNITNSAISAGERLVRALSIDQVSAGWDKLTKKTSSVQTLVNSTGKTVDEINSYLEKLMWYSDETSYGFTDMTSALATMVSSGGDINKLIPMIEGVANATAFAGKGASEFSRIMQYAVNQAYSLGYMQVQDWKTIEGATVNSKQLIQSLITAGEELGKIKKGSVTIENFRSTLADKWVDKEVMESGFGAFSKVTEEIYKGIQDGTFKNYADGLAKIGDKFGEFAYRAAASSQEAKSFAEAIDATKDAVSSGWMKTFELIFGNYEEQRVLWTDLSNALWDVFASGAERRNAVLEEWANLGGRTTLVEAFWAAWNNVAEVLGVVRDAFREVFPPATAEQLLSITKALKSFADSLKISEDTADKLRRTFKGLFSIVDIFRKLVGGVFKTAIKMLCQLLGMADTDLLSLTARIGDVITKFRDWLTENNYITKGLEALVGAISAVIKKIREWIKKLWDLPQVQNAFKKVSQAVQDCMANFEKYIGIGINKIGEFFSQLKNLDSITLKDIGAAFKNVGNTILTYFVNIFGSFGNFQDLVNKMRYTVKTRFLEMSESVDGLRNRIFDFVLEARSKVKSNFGIGEILTLGVGTGLIATIRKVNKIIAAVKKPLAEIGKVLGNFNGILVSVKNAVNAHISEIKSRAVLNVARSIEILAKSIGIIAASIVVLTLVDQDKLWSAVGALAALAGVLVAVSAAMAVINKFLGGNFKNSLSIVSMAASILILVAALKKMEELDSTKVYNSAAVLGVLGAGLVLFAGLLGKLVPHLSKGALGLVAIAVSLKIIASALKDLDGVDLESLNRSVGILIGIIVGLVIVSVACSSITIGAGAGILALVISLKILINVLKSFGDLNVAKMRASMDVFSAIFSKFIWLMAVSSLAGKNAARGGLGILAMSAALVLIMISFKMIAGMDIGTLHRVTAVVTQLLTVFGRLMVLSIFAGPNAAKAGVMLLAVSGALILLAGAMVILGHLKPEGIKQALGIIAVLELLFMGLIAVTSLAKDCKGTLIVVAVTIGILVAALGALSMIEDQSKLRNVAVCLSAIIAAFTVLVASTSLVKKATGTMIVMTVIVAALGGILFALSSLPMNSVLPVAEALSLLLVAMSASLLILSGVKYVAPTAMTAMGIMIAIVAGLAVIVGVLARFDLGNSAEIAVGLSTLLMSLSKSCAILTVVGLGGGAAYAGIGALITLIAAMGVLMEAIGRLVADNVLNEENLTKAIEILNVIGNGIGTFIGSIVGGIMGGISSSLPQVGKDLSDFMTNLQPFIDGAKSITHEMLDGVNALAQTILILTAANVIDGLSRWFTGGRSLSSFADEVKPLGTALKEFAGEVKDLNVDDVAKAAEAGLHLAEMISLLPTKGGLNKLFTGSVDVDKFKTQMAAFAEGITAFAGKVDGLKTDDISKATDAGKAIAEMMQAFPTTGSTIEKFFKGETDMSVFGTQLVGFGESIKTYADSVDGLKVSVVENSVTAGKALAELANNVPKSGSEFLTALIGENNIGTFGTQIVSFGEAMKDYADSVDGLNGDVVENSRNIANTLVELAKSVPTSGAALKNLFTGENNIAKFGEQLSDFGKSFVEFYNSVGEIEASKLAGIVTEIDRLVDIAATIGDAEKGAMSGFAKGLKDLGKAGIDGLINSFANAGTQISTAIDLLVGVIGSKNEKFVSAGKTMMTKLASGIKSGGPQCRSSTASLLSDCLTAINSRASDFYSAGLNAAAEFANGITANTYLAVARASAMAAAAAAAARSELDIHSPSGVSYGIGEFFGLGFVNALGDYANRSYAAGESIGNAAREGLRTAISKIGEFVENGIDTQPTIRPVLDLSNVSSGVGKLSALMSRTQAMKISAGMDRESSGTIQNGNEKSSIANNYNFTQNNYSPKSLSRIDIYRQTKNQFAALKGLVET